MSNIVEHGRKDTKQTALASENKNKIFFPTDDDCIVMGGKAYGDQTEIRARVQANAQAITDEVARATAAEQAIIYDVSAHNNGAVFESLQALLSSSNLSTLIPASVRHGGMSIRFIQGSVPNSDNKYVQYRLMADDWSTNTDEWAISDNGVYVENSEFIYVKTDAEGRVLYAIKTDGSMYYGAGVPKQIVDYINERIAKLPLNGYEDIVTFLNDLEKGDKTLDELLAEKADKKVLDTKVNKEENKGLIYNQYVEECEHDELIKATCDAEGKVLQGIKKDGSPYFPHHEMMEVDEIPGYNNVVLDNENKIVEGINKDGRHVFNAGIEVGQLKTESGIESGDWLDVKIDSEYKILEGINKEGEKHISKFDKSTQDLIKGFTAGSDYISIPMLDANFTSPVPIEITGIKGSDDARYVFDLPLSDYAFNIRFKFRITENLLNTNKSAVIAKLGNTNAVSAVPLSLTQYITSEKYNEETKTNYWPTLIGGIRLNGSDVTNEYHNNIGNFAFCVKYIGEENEAYIENDGTKFILTIGENVINFNFTSYPTVYSLYSALRNRKDLEVSYQEIENRNSNELAIFNKCKLKCVFYTGTTGSYKDPIEEYIDSAPFFIPYAVGDKWHKVEIVKIGGTIYSSCDGITNTLSETGNILTLGGECGVIFKNLEIHTKDSYDAEITSNGFLISSANPYILVYEGHGIDGVPVGDGYSSDSMATSVDRLYYVYNIAINKGYIPVSISDIAEYYAGNKELPKRCISSVFDDYRFANCLDLDNRRVFTSLGIKPALAVVSSLNMIIKHYDPISETEVEISELEAARICKLYDFSLISHTRNHRDITYTKPSTYMNQFTMDIYDADLKDIDGSIIVYPRGLDNLYVRDTLRWLGCRLGISIENLRDTSRNTFNRSRYRLLRREIGFRANISYILSTIL